MKNSKLFQYIFIGAFIFFIIVGVILFSTYRSANQSLENISITLWGTLPADAFSSFVSKFFSESDLKYTVNYSEKNPTTFEAELVEALASGTGPDAVILPADLIVHFSNKIYPIPYASLPELTFKNTFIQEGELYLTTSGALALPFSVDPLVMYWNRDIFNNAGVTKPPVTWSEILNLIPKMTRVDSQKNVLASTVALGEFRNVQNAKEILSALIMQSGSPIVTVENGAFKSTLKETYGLKNSPAYLALQYFTNFSNPVKAEYSWNRSLTNSQTAFTNGDLALYFGLASEYLTLKNKNPNLNFGVALLPQITGTRVYNTYGQILGFSILRTTPDPAGAYTILGALTSAAAFPYWSNVFNVSSARRDILNVVDNSAVKTIFNQSAIISKGWLDPNKSATNAIFQSMVESFTTGRMTLDGAINSASDQLDNLL